MTDRTDPTELLALATGGPLWRAAWRSLERGERKRLAAVFGCQPRTSLEAALALGYVRWTERVWVAVMTVSATLTVTRLYEPSWLGVSLTAGMLAFHYACWRSVRKIGSFRIAWIHDKISDAKSP